MTRCISTRIPGPSTRLSRRPASTGNSPSTKVSPQPSKRGDPMYALKRSVLIAALLSCGAVLSAQAPAPPILQEPQTIKLWQGKAPGALGDADEDTPTLTIYMPPATTGPPAGVVVPPGGGYRSRSMNKEGRLPASYLNSLGIAAFVLKYRLGPKYHHPVELGDIQRAVRTLRSRAAEWHLDASRIGVMGFSAGGHLAATVSSRHDEGNASATDPIDRVSSRPDFAILGYPVITFTEAWTHQGSKTMLLGDKPDPALARSLSAETQVTAKTPPTFLFHTNADTTV